MATLSDVRAVQREWFSRKNKRFFGDISYKVLHGKATKRPYLVRSTFMWSDMFGQPKQVRWRVNELKEDLRIGPLVDDIFRDYDDVKEWLATH
jgi:hypothetical protein